VIRVKQKFPKFVDEYGKQHTCIGFAVSGTGWEWFAFEDEGNGIFFGFVMGFENEWGTFSVEELASCGIPFTQDPDDLNDIMPPEGWSKAA
jgi:hypothetical protein